MADDANEPKEGTEQVGDDASQISQGLLDFYRLIYPQYSVKDIAEALKAQKDKLGDELFSKQISDYGTYPELLMRSLDAHTDQSQFMHEILKKIVDKDKVGDAWEYVPNEGADPKDQPFSLKNRVSSLNQSLKGAEVSGREARVLILSANKNIKKLFLYNSGFNIIIRAPTMVEVNLVYNRLNDALGEYGRMLGAVFFLYSDLKIKNILWDFIRSLVIDSNLNRYDDGHRLRNNLSIQDYAQIILNIGSLMYKTGYPFSHVCVNTECSHEEQLLIDLGLIQLNDYSKIPHEQLSFLASSRKINPEDLVKYRKALGFNDSFDLGKYRIHRHVPSMTDYMSYGDQFNDEMVMMLHDLKDEDKITQYLQFNYARLFEPWIRYIEVLHDDGSVSFKVTDRENLTLILTQIQSGDDRDKFAEIMTDYTKLTTITYLGYPVKPCPKCGKMPTYDAQGFTSFDAQTSFFTMAIRALIERS